MTTSDCEDVCMAAMAREDGYASVLSADQIKAHLVNCADCRREVQELRTLHNLLDGQKRRQRTENVWQQVEQRLPDTSTAQNNSQSWYPLLLLGFLLLGYRLVEMIPDRQLSFVFKLVPVILAVAAFSYLRENPFKINTQLSLQGE